VRNEEGALLDLIWVL